ncbi:MAG: Protein N-acetyltransferase, RimJ/RimL family [Mucilaginibacter sp.]|nr:Protein N-acetyltransferase, RimJ/RimL family [Mucilaginibacter sp.]
MTLNFDLNANYALEDERVLLRPLLESDFELLLPFATNEPDTWKYSYLSARGEDGMRRYIKDALDNKAAGKEYPFIVYDKQTQSYAGSTRFYDIQQNWQTMQLGYTWYGERFRGTGLNKHCKFLLLQLAFETLDAVRVEFRADARNDRSIAAMKSIGCVPEGILRNNMPLQEGGRRDSIVLSILKEEWDTGVKDLLKSKMEH